MSTEYSWTFEGPDGTQYSILNDPVKDRWGVKDVWVLVRHGIREGRPRKRVVAHFDTQVDATMFACWLEDLAER